MVNLSKKAQKELAKKVANQIVENEAIGEAVIDNVKLILNEKGQFHSISMGLKLEIHSDMGKVDVNRTIFMPLNYQNDIVIDEEVAAAAAPAPKVTEDAPKKKKTRKKKKNNDDGAVNEEVLTPDSVNQDTAYPA